MLKSLQSFSGVSGPVVTIVMDGMGLSTTGVGDAIKAARTPTLDKLFKNYPNTAIKAHGTAVGMPSDEDMGNSEVGHNAIGSGQVYNQGASLVQEAIADGSLFERDGWKEVTANALSNNSTLHLIGLFSDGNVHSHIDHVKAMITKAKAQGIASVRVHALLDGRDVPETSALEYIEPFEQFLATVNDASFNARIASGGGRMYITMDRYEANWSQVERGWQTHVLGEGRQFGSATEAVETLRAETGAIDQDLGAFVISENGAPIGTIEDNDSVIFFNFRGDRAIELSLAFEAKEFSKFDRKRVPNVTYAGMLEYDGDLHIPSRYLVPPPSIKHTMGEYLVKTGVKQFACSETQKYGHVTYFWNGNRSGKFSETLETYVEVLSDVVPFEQRPWMKSAEIADELIKALQSGEYKYLRVNFANGDMVGHTGNFFAAVIAVEAVDLALSRVLPVVDAMQGIAIITADHGNADEMYEIDKKTGEAQMGPNGPKAKTAHTLNQVPAIIYDNTPTKDSYSIKEGVFGLSNLAATAVNLLGYEAPDIWDETMIEFK
jgi:2,3-bisphosphoglycerate-independent phosphoglycerate mutase